MRVSERNKRICELDDRIRRDIVELEGHIAVNDRMKREIDDRVRSVLQIEVPLVGALIEEHQLSICGSWFVPYVSLEGTPGIHTVEFSGTAWIDDVKRLCLEVNTLRNQGCNVMLEDMIWTQK